MAGRAGFEYHPFNRGRRLNKKRAPCWNAFFWWRGGRDSNPRLVLPSTHLAGEPIQPLWHLPILGLRVPGWWSPTSAKKPSNVWTFYHATLSGGSGIRTHVGFHQTCFQDMHLQPLGHPSRSSAVFRERRRFYHKIEEGRPTVLPFIFC